MKHKMTTTMSIAIKRELSQAKALSGNGSDYAEAKKK